MSNYSIQAKDFSRIETHLATISKRGKPQWVLARDKQPIQRGWPECYPTINEVSRHLRSGGMLGVIPRSIDTLVVDADYDEKQQTHIVEIEDIEDIGISQKHFYRCNTKTENARHWYFHCKLEEGFTKINDWKYGDILYDRSFVIMWNLVEALPYIEAKLVMPRDVRGMICEPITSIPVIPSRLRRKDNVARHALKTNTNGTGRIAVGNRNNVLNMQSYLAGLSGDLAAKSDAEQVARNSDLPEGEIQPTSDSGFNAGLRDALTKFAIEYGFKNASKFTDDVLDKVVETEIDLKEQEAVCVPHQRYTYKLLHDCLEVLGLELKYDIIDEHFEILLKKDFDTPISEEFEKHLKPGISVRLTERLEPMFFHEITLHVRFNQQNKQTKKFKEIEFIPKHRKDCMLAYSNNVEFNPLINWIKNGPGWDGKPRLVNFYRDTFNAKVDGDKEWLVAFAGLLTFIGPIQRNLHPGCQQDWMVVLVGPQGIQKSTFVRSLQPPGMDLFSSSPDLNMGQKQLYESTDGCVFVELNEMKGVYDTSGSKTPKSQREKLKDYISSRTDRRRIPYERKSVTRPRYLTLFGTSNTKHCVPYDPSGYRRFIVLELQKKPEEGIEQLMQSYVDKDDESKGTLQQQLYAEAMFQYDERGKEKLLYNVSTNYRLEQLQHELIALEYSTGSMEAVNRLDEASDEAIEGLTRRQIAKSFGCNDAVVSTSLKKRGFMTFKKTINGVTARRFHKSVHDAQSWAEDTRNNQ